MKDTIQLNQTFERWLIGILAIIASGILVYLAILGPLFKEILQYKTSPSAIYQTMGQDIVNIIVLAPLLFVGGILSLKDHPAAKYLLIFTPIYLIYMALSYGIGMEWSDSRYSGNSYDYFFLYLFLIIAGLLLLMYTLSRFCPEDSPQFSSRQINIYIIIVGLFLIIFAKMWIDEVLSVISTGDTPTGSYTSAPTVFWVIRYFDLGFTIPLGFISLYLMKNRLSSAYPYLLLFYGFFVTMIIAVNAMGAIMWYYDDPEFQLGDLYVFWILAILSFAGYIFLIKDKFGILKNWNIKNKQPKFYLN